MGLGGLRREEGGVVVLINVVIIKLLNSSIPHKLKYKKKVFFENILFLGGSAAVSFHTPMSFKGMFRGSEASRSCAAAAKIQLDVTSRNRIWHLSLSIKT